MLTCGWIMAKGQKPARGKHLGVLRVAVSELNIGRKRKVPRKKSESKSGSGRAKGRGRRRTKPGMEKEIGKGKGASGPENLLLVMGWVTLNGGRLERNGLV